MTLTPGTKLGPYEIIAPLGVGGMGEVYRARDTKLGRDVALKVLPAAFATDPERMARFRREAQVLASLNHPHIGAIYGFEDSGNTHALVMELIEGPTLADRIVRGAIPIGEALPIAREIAEALEAAHERGIVHRDLKPANIKITPDGGVKVLDFGLAKAVEADSSATDLHNSPTLTRMSTQAGIILGTAAYMSPEQAKGKSVDRRTDIWAFGCALFEMLTGKRAFDGETVTDTIASVMKDDPAWSALPAVVPLRVRELLRRCLMKDPKQRLQAIGEARIALDDNSNVTSSAFVAAAVPAAGSAPVALPRRGTFPWGLLAAALAVALAVCLFYLWRFTNSSATPPVMRFAISLPNGQSPATDRGWMDLAVSSDGSEIAYIADNTNPQLWVRRMDKLVPTLLADTERASSPFFSPDGKWIAFFVDGKLEKIAVTGGVPTVLCDATQNRGGTWLPDGTIFFSPALTAGLMKIPSGGGTPTAVISPDTSKGERTQRWPQVLPGGEEVIFTLGSLDSPTNFDNAKIAVLSLKTGKYKILIDGAGVARYVPTDDSHGYILYIRSGNLFATPFDAKNEKVDGEAFSVVQGVSGTRASGAALFGVSQDGSLVYVPGATSSFGAYAMLLVDSAGKADSLQIPVQYYYQYPELSPDGKHVAVGVGGATNSAITDIYVLDTERGVLSRLTFSGDSDSPTWSLDGKRIAYRSSKPEPGIYWKAADGSGQEEALYVGPVAFAPPSFSPDGKFLSFTTPGVKTGSDISILPLDGKRQPHPFIATPANESNPAFSPDGRWLAYLSDESGRSEVYVQAFPGPGGKWQISSGNREAKPPIWARDGRAIYYLADDKFMAVPVETHPSFSPGTPEELFQSPSLLVGGSAGASFLGGVSPAGKRFLLLSPRKPEALPASEVQINVIVNFASELKRLAPQGDKR